MRLPERLLALVVLLAFLLPAAAQDEKFAVEVVGVGGQPFTLTPENLSGLAPVEMEVTFETSKGPSTGRYRGMLLWDVFQANHAFDGLERNAELRKTFAVRGRDGYIIAFSVGEIHPDFGNLRMILADQVDGKPLEGGYRLVVPGDRRGARNVREVVEIAVR